MTQPETDDEMFERLLNAYVNRDDDVFSEVKAAMYLNLDFKDRFPIEIERNGERHWITELETDSFDGPLFIGRSTEVREQECPECGFPYAEDHYYNDGHNAMGLVKCVLCGHYLEEHGP